MYDWCFLKAHNRAHINVYPHPWMHGGVAACVYIHVVDCGWWTRVSTDRYAQSFIGLCSGPFQLKDKNVQKFLYQWPFVSINVSAAFMKWLSHMFTFIHACLFYTCMYIHGDWRLDSYKEKVCGVVHHQTNSVSYGNVRSSRKVGVA